MPVDPYRSRVADGGHGGPTKDTETTGAERILADVLADVLRLEHVSADCDFFDDLGADSLTMAHFCARVRKREDLPSVSMEEIYRHPTIGRLATALADAGRMPVGPSIPASSSLPARASSEMATASTLEYALCGALQLLAVLGYAYVVALLLALGSSWVLAASGLLDAYLRTVVVAGATFVGLSTFPIVAKWTLIGRWERQEIRIWSLAYVRFWIVKILVQRNPLVMFVGSPLYVLYLRALGAKIGRGVVILSAHVPVCTDLLSIGGGTVIRKDSFFTCYRALGGVIQTGAVTLGRDVVVGEAAVLDIDTSVGDEAQLGHASSLQSGQAVPDGERRQGFSAQQRTDVDYRGVDPIASATLLPAVYPVLQLLWLLALLVPLGVAGITLLLASIPPLVAIPGSGQTGLASLGFLGGALAVSCVLFFGALLVGLVVVVTVPRLLNLAIKPDTAYRLYGFHYWVHRAIGRLTNVPYFVHLFGDSSYIVHYLRGIGYDLSHVEQTGSNFGLEVKHETPFLATVGRGTMAADGLSIINADYSSTSFRVSRATIGSHSFLGNYVTYPSQAQAGDDLLLATKVLVPVDGHVRDGVGLLGSPSFEIPRSVQRDSRFDHLKSDDGFRRRLAAKDRHNAVTIGLFLLVQWLFVFGVTMLAAGAINLYPSLGAAVFAGATVLTVAFSTVYFALVERAATLFRDLRPMYCSIYEPYFWWHERYWKLGTQPNILDGTPFKGLAWRLLGVKIGKRVFDDGGRIVEKTLVTLGDDCTLNARSLIQPHSQEEGTFKSDRITIGARSTLGIGSLVHYGVTMGDDAVLAPDSFLMKGEDVPRSASWAGNPAREVDDRLPRTATVGAW
jgi:non-ribosomal peptide synthetase-like protein